MRSLRVASVATLLTLSTLLAGCGGDDDKDSKSDDEVTETVTESPSETTTTDATETPTDATPMDPTATSDVTQDQLDAALLTAEEVSPDFTLASWTPSSDPLPCDPSGTPVDEAVPPSVSGGTELDHNSGNAALIEEIQVYDTDALAAEAYGLGTAGLSCTDGTLPDGTAITLEAAQDVTDQVNTNGLGTTTAWAFSTEGINGAFVATLAGRVILTCTFQSLSDADTSGLPSPIDVQATAFAKALAS